MTVLREEIQQMIYDDPRPKPKGAMFVKNGTYFKFKNLKVYYYHASQQIWERSVLFTTKEVSEFYKCYREE